MDLFAAGLPDDVGDPAVREPGRTPPPARAPRTAEERIDLDAWGTEPPPRGRSRRWLLAVAAVPWVVVAALMATGTRAPTDPVPERAPAPTGAPGTPSDRQDAAPTATARPDDPEGVTTGGTVMALGGATGPSSRGAAEGLAVVVTRSWLSTRPDGPPVEGLEPAPGARDRYVEHVAVESIDHPARGGAVVTVRAVVLPIEGDSYGPADQLRVAVPLVLEADRARLAGTPWLLPIDAPTLAPVRGSPVDDPDLLVAASEAVAAAGYRDVALTSLERTSSWAWVARVDARAPDDSPVREHALWLRSDVGRLVVAGTTPPASTSPSPPAPSPAPHPSPTEASP